MQRTQYDFINLQAKTQRLSRCGNFQSDLAAYLKTVHASGNLKMGKIDGLHSADSVCEKCCADYLSEDGKIALFKDIKDMAGWLVGRLAGVAV